MIDSPDNVHPITPKKGDSGLSFETFMALLTMVVIPSALSFLAGQEFADNPVVLVAPVAYISLIAYVLSYGGKS